METENNNSEKNILEENNLSQRRLSARMEMENEDARKRRETREKIQKTNEEKESIKNEVVENVNVQTNIEKEEIERKANIDRATAITKEFEKIKAAGPQISSVRTFKYDMDDTVKNQNISQARITMQEEARRRDDSEQSETVKSKNAIYIVLSLLFVISGGILGWYTYINIGGSTEIEDVTKVTIFRPIIYSELNKEIEYSSFSKQNLLSEIKKEIFLSEIPEGKVKNIIITKKQSDGTVIEANSSLILDILSPQSPEEFRRSLAEKAGIYSVAPLNGEKAGALVFTSDSYQKTFAGALNWEKRTMVKDIYEMLNGAIPQENIMALTFTDVVINNQDARSLVDENGQTRLIYGFINNKTIIFTGNIDAFNEIVNRLKNNKT